MTIAQQIKWDFEVNGSLEILDKNSNLIYFENSKGGWDRREYNSEEKLIYCENSDGYWVKHEYDSQGKVIYFESSNGFWAKYEYDSGGNRIYYENSDGLIIDNRPKTCENKEIVIGGEKFKLVKV
jgi:hypothetical protein